MTIEEARAVVVRRIGGVSYRTPAEAAEAVMAVLGLTVCKWCEGSMEVTGYGVWGPVIPGEDEKPAE